MKLLCTYLIVISSYSAIYSQIGLEYLHTHAETSQVFYGQGQPMTQIDQQGNAIIAGHVGSSVGFSDGLSISNVSQGRDLFIIKRNPSGERLWHLKLTSSDDNSWINGMKVDHEGNIFITGRVNGNLQLNPQGGASISTPNNPKGYVAKYSPEGDYLWHKEFGSTSWFTYGEDLTLDGFGNVYVTGDMGNDFFLGDIEIFDSATTVYCFKLTPSGSVAWARTYTDSRIGHQEKIVFSGGSIHIVSSFSGGKDFDTGPGQSVVFALGDNDLMFLTINPISGLLTNIGPIRSNGKQIARKVLPYHDNYIILISDYNSSDRLLSTRVYTKINDINDHRYNKLKAVEDGTLGTFDISENNVFATAHTNKYDLVFDPTSAIVPLIFTGDGYSYLEKEHYSSGVFDIPNIPTDGVVNITEIIQREDAIYLSGTFFGDCSFALDPDNLNVSSGRYQKAFVAKYTNCVIKDELYIEDCSPVEFEGNFYETSQELQSANFGNDACLTISDVELKANKAQATVSASEESISGSFGLGDILWLEFLTDEVVATDIDEITPAPGQYYVSYIDANGCEYVSNPLTLPTRTISDPVAESFGKNIFTSNIGELFVESTRSNWSLVPIQVDYPEASTKSALVNGGIRYKSIAQVDQFTLVGSYRSDEVFVYDSSSDNQFVSFRINPQSVPDVDISDFSYAMEIYDDFLFVGAPTTDLAGGKDAAGTIQVFKVAGGDFEYHTSLQSSLAEANLEFGSAIFVSNRHCFVLESGYTNSFGKGRLYQYDLSTSAGNVSFSLVGSIESTSEFSNISEEIAVVNGKLLLRNDSKIGSFDIESLTLEDTYESSYAISKFASNAEYAVFISEEGEGENKEAVVISVNAQDELAEKIRFYSNDDSENYGSGLAISLDNTVLVAADQYQNTDIDGIVYYYNLNDLIETNTTAAQKVLDVKVIPNPVLETFRIATELPILSVEIVDPMGRVVLTSTKDQIDISSLSPGMYVIRVKSIDEKIITRKIIKS